MTRLFYIVSFRRRYLAVKHLDEDVNMVKKFQRQSKYEVGSAEWNPSDLNCHLCAISVRFYEKILFYIIFSFYKYICILPTKALLFERCGKDASIVPFYFGEYFFYFRATHELRY